MKKPIEVKEYDTIARNIIPEVDNSVFEELLSFIEKFKKTGEISDVHDFMSLSHEKDYGYTISFKNYVGLIQLKSGIQFNILPKIDLDENCEDKGNEKTKKTFLYMLRSMRNYPGKSFNTASLNVARMPLLDIFIRMYLQEVLNLVKQGIRSSYVGEEDNLRYFKGKLLFAQHLRCNLAHQERFFVTFEDFNINRPENKLIKAALLKLQRISSNAGNLQLIKRFLAVFDFVDASTNFVKDFQKVVNNRDTKIYIELLSWTKIILLNQTFTPFAGTKSAISFLFPMEQVFEEYVAKHIKRVFSEDGWNVFCQEKELYLSPKLEMFGIKPDIVLKYYDKTVIMDTKWKRLKAEKEKNYEIKQEDIYQMYAYAKRYETKHIWLLYPYSKETLKNEIPNRIEMFDGVVIRIFFVNVAQEKIIDSLNQLKKEVGEELKINNRTLNNIA